MLSMEKAKFRSALERTMSQMHSDKVLNINPAHTRGIATSLKMKCKSVLRDAIETSSIELIDDLRKSWLIVSQIDVSMIKDIIRNSPVSTYAFSSCDVRDTNITPIRIKPIPIQRRRTTLSCRNIIEVIGTKI